MSANVHFEPEPGSRDAMPGIGVPKPALYMAGVLILLVFALAISARVFGFGAFSEPQGTVLLTRTLTFTDAADGGIHVHDAETQTLATTLEPGTSNFVRGALRALTRKRRLANIGPEIPFVLTRYDDGRLVLRDSATKASVTISSFGPTQMEAFDPLLIVGRAPGDGAPPPENAGAVGAPSMNTP